MIHGKDSLQHLLGCALMFIVLCLAAPQPADPWEGMRDATKIPNVCPQDMIPMETLWNSFPVEYPSIQVSEDCLYLNVYRPTGPPAREKLPAPGWNELIVDEYLQQLDSPEDIREAFTELLGDMVLVLPVLQVATYHRDAGVPLYLYELKHLPLMHGEMRPSFVKADHFDDALLFLGACFCTRHTTVRGPVTEEEKDLSRKAMAHIGNFARTGSPNGPGLVEWPQYDHSESYLKIHLQQTVGQRLKQNQDFDKFASLILSNAF